MDETVSAYDTLAWLLGFLAFIFLFFRRGLKAYLMQFRHRELRKDLGNLRRRLNRLFQLIEDNSRYERIFMLMPTLMVAVLAVSWSVLTFGRLVPILESLPHQALVLAFVAWCLLSAFFLLFLLGWLPLLLGPRFPVPLSLAGTYCLLATDILLRPLTWILDNCRRVFGAFGMKGVDFALTPETDFQIMALAKEGKILTPITEKIAVRSLDLSEICVYDILLPRNQVQIFDLNDGIVANLEKARKTGHTRFPLCRGDLDQCIGIIHIKDLFRSRQPIESIDLEKLARPIVNFDQEQPLDKVLAVLLQKRVHMALVQDEFGGVLGVLTLERILEELVGEIQDEFDKEDRMIIQLKKDFYKISGLAPIHEVEVQLGLNDLENDEVSSFGGLITYHLGRIPQKGEVVEIGPLLITILETDGTRIVSANARVLSLP